MRKGELQYLEQNFVRRKEEVAKRDCWEWWRTRRWVTFFFPRIAS